MAQWRTLRLSEYRRQIRAAGRWPQSAAALALSLGLFTPTWAQDPADGSPTSESTQKETVFEDYLRFKQDVKQRTGLGFGFQYSLMHAQRAGTSLNENNYNLSGQFDFLLTWDLFGGRGRFNLYYMDLHQLGEIETSEFVKKNGLITPINDSDPVSMLRQLYYEHHFFKEKLILAGGKTEVLAVFGGNRYAGNDRRDFQALPLSNAAAKDRTFQSPGFFARVRPIDWLSLGSSVNSLNFSRGIPDKPFDVSDVYSIFNITLDPEIKTSLWILRSRISAKGSTG